MNLKLLPLVLSLFLCSCGQAPVAKINLVEANEKFTTLCKKENNYPVITHIADNTLWIYLPLEKNILEIKPVKKIEDVDKEMNKKPNVNFLDGSFADGVFSFEYDISETRNYKKSFSYTSGYTEEYQRIQQNILNAIQRVYFEGKEEPTFVVLVIADIKSGLEMESIFYFKDLKQSLGMAATISQDEFIKRYVYELRGSEEIINDTQGKHLHFHDVAMTDFLIKQIINRANFKYQRSSFTPSDDHQKEIIDSIQETFHAYDFQNFTSVQLIDLFKNTTQTLIKSDLTK